MRDDIDLSTGELISPKGILTFGDQMEFHNAFFECQKDLPAVIGKDKSNPHFRSKYTSLPAIMLKVRPILHHHGFSIDHGCSFSAFTETSSRCAFIEVFAEICHVETCILKRRKLPVPVPKLDPQAVGSAMTYGKRYTTLAVLGIADGDEDDDGQAAMSRKITEEAKDSPSLASIKKDMAKIKEATELVVWAGEAKVQARINGLNDGEAEILRAAFKAHRDKLVSEAQNG